MGESSKFQILTGKICKNIFLTVPSCALFYLISSQGVQDTFIYNMDNLCMLIVIWSIDMG